MMYFLLYYYLQLIYSVISVNAKMFNNTKTHVYYSTREKKTKSSERERERREEEKMRN